MDAEEAAIVKVWKCLSTKDRSSLMSDYGFTYAQFEGEFTGVQWMTDDKKHAFYPGMGNCLPMDISDAAGDDDWARKWVDRHTAEEIATEVDLENGVANVANLLKAFIDGATLADDEFSITKVIQALSSNDRCSRLRDVSSMHRFIDFTVQKLYRSMPN